MRSNYLIITTLSVLVVLFLASSLDVNAGAYSFSSLDKQQPLSLAIQNGGILNAGPQEWTMHGGVLGDALDTSTPGLSAITWSALNYSMTADVEGLTATGSFSLHLVGVAANGTIVNLRVHATVVSAIPAVCFPSYTLTGTCLASDTSEIPAYFVASGFYRVRTGSVVTPKTSITLVIEDAALNPFGAPIVISSVDMTLLVVATYDHARTVWSGVQTEGTLTGTLGSTPVSGSFVQTTRTSENYVTGTATDSGYITLVGMTPASLNGNGDFHGTSTIPTTGTMDCSPPALPGTCTETGYASTGTFSLDPAGLQITGNYNVQWPAPSIVFGGTITAKVQ